MAPKKKYKFYVVELQVDSRIANGRKYTCIPFSWIKFPEDEYGEILFKYPEEDSLVTESRIKKEEKYSQDWETFIAVIKYRTNSYEDATDYIEVLNRMIAQEKNSTEIEAGVPSTSGVNTFGSLPNAETNKVNINSALLSYNLTTYKLPKEDQTTSRLKKFSYSNMEVWQTTNADEAARDKITNKIKTRNQLMGSDPQLISKCITDINMTEQNPQNEYSEQNNEMLSDESIMRVVLRQVLGHNCKETLELLRTQIEKQFMLLKILCSANRRNSEGVKIVIDILVINGTDIASSILKETLRESLGDDYKQKFEMIHSDLEKEKEVLEILCFNVVQCSAMLNTWIDLNDNTKNNVEANIDKITKILNQNLIVSNKQDNDKKTQEAQNNTSEENNIKFSEEININFSEENNINSNEENNNDNPSNKLRGRLQKFTLPPEYDPEDTKWTLKHRTKRNGLRELLENSHIYVDQIKATHHERMSKDSKTLARNMILEVFNNNALSVCSIKGRRPNGFILEGEPRPGLDEHAMNVLLKYVENFAIKKNWHYYSRKEIENSIRNKLQFFRYKSKEKNTGKV